MGVITPLRKIIMKRGMLSRVCASKTSFTVTQRKAPREAKARRDGMRTER